MRKKFNVTLVEYLNVYAGRASELYPLQLENLYQITVETFKIEKVSPELFHKMSILFLHCVKLGKIEFAVRSILDISLSAARRDQESSIKYVRF